MNEALRTPLALSILSLLLERPMHPYEMRTLMRERAHDRVVKLTGGSLYSTIDRLAAAGLIQAVQTSRQGRRPERTVYALTETGKTEHLRWLRELIAVPIHEFPWFGSVLAFLALVPSAEAADLLQRRAAALEETIAASERDLVTLVEMGIPRLFGVEGEYAVAMRRAELAWVRRIVAEIRSGELVWPAEVLALQERLAKEESS
jgi:DNA-binding PadR family transcriptional regulator